MQRRKKVTTDHEEIKKWAEKHAGKPEMIDDSRAGADKTAIRLHFAGARGDMISPRLVRRVSWEDFFRRFDELDYAFVYEEGGDAKRHPSDAFRFIRREHAQREMLD